MPPVPAVPATVWGRRAATCGCWKSRRIASSEAKKNKAPPPCFKPAGTPSPKTTAERVAALRAELKRQNLTGFLIGRGDEHQGEYVPKRAERLSWISGFTGSAGLVIVLLDRAAIFVDGRYTLQVKDEVDTGIYEIKHLINDPAERWIEAHLGKGGRLGIRERNTTNGRSTTATRPWL